MCDHVLNEGKLEEMTEAVRDEMEDINETLASRGERVLAFAYLDLPKNKYPLEYKFDGD